MAQQEKVKADKPAAGLRITITMESRSVEGMEWALAQGLKFARERWMGVTVHHKDDPETRVSCRTTKLRKRATTQIQDPPRGEGE